MYPLQLLLALGCLFGCRLVAAQVDENCNSVQQPPTVEYIVYPVNGMDQTRNSNNEDFIKSIIGQDALVDSYTSESEGLLWWSVYMNAAQACRLMQNSSEILLADETGKYQDAELDRPTRVAPRAPEFTSQNKAVAELVILSQPKTVPDYTKLENYVYNVNAGQGTYIYIVEEGIDDETDDLEDKVNQIIYSKSRSGSGPQDDSPDGHTTCVASKAAGKNFGVAKKAELINVKMGLRNVGDIASIFDQILSDVQKKNRQGKAIINLSWGTTPPSDGKIPMHWITAGRHLRKLMNEEDVIVIASAGNHKLEPGRTNIDKYPQVFAEDDFPIINVGNSLANGLVNKNSQIGPKLHVWAVGTDITCASARRMDPNTPWNPDHKDTGTSFSAPTVAGLLAYFLSLDTVPFSTEHGKLALNARNFMRDQASWQRGGPDEGFPNVAWNLVTEDQNKPSS